MRRPPAGLSYFYLLLLSSSSSKWANAIASYCSIVRCSFGRRWSICIASRLWERKMHFLVRYGFADEQPTANIARVRVPRIIFVFNGPLFTNRTTTQYFRRNGIWLCDQRIGETNCVLEWSSSIWFFVVVLHRSWEMERTRRMETWMGESEVPNVAIIIIDNIEFV